MIVRFLLSAGAVLASLSAVSPAHADALIDHINGFTLDRNGAIERFTGLLIDKDGRVKQLLHDGDPRPARLDFLNDGHGAVVMPGFVDSHAHVMALGFAALTLDLSDTHSLGEAQQKIAAYAAKFPGRPWIIGRGWDADRWALGRLPTAADLDAVVADRPVWLESADGHAGWANSRALVLAGITAATKDPIGGRIERLPAPPAPPQRRGQRAAPHVRLGAPAGVLVDAAMAPMLDTVPPPRPEDRDLALSTAQTILIEHGITAVTDMGTTIEDWQAYRRAGDLGRLRLRIMGYAAGTEAMQLIAGPGPTPWLYDDRLHMSGVDLVADGALASRGAWLKAPYADAPATSGLPQLSDTALKNLMSRAAIDHFQVAVEATGDAATAAVLDAVSAMADTYKGDRRWRIEQAGMFAPQDLPRLGQLNAQAGGIVATMRPGADMAMITARLGPARAPLASAWKSVAASGVTLTFGSDTPAQTPDPFAGIATVTSADNPQGVPLAQALAGYTARAAWAGFAEGHFGRLLPGERADFVMVDRDITKVPPAEIGGTKVLQVWVGGLPVYRVGDEGNK
ncbi:MAG: amidohydrolase family protein [Sphingomonadales bacterium]|nr:amidohydrolase family protein [Sphingomonadales bacterium]MDE2168311.1 amidohydrolase family protein [Sphingomonadales bacterium]